MGIIKVQIRLADKEWKQIEEIVQKKYEGKPVKIYRGKGHQHFIHAEITKLFRELQLAECKEEKSTRTSKTFSLKFEDHIENKIRCLANKLGIEPGMLISRMALDPYLFPNH